MLLGRLLIICGTGALDVPRQLADELEGLAEEEGESSGPLDGYPRTILLGM